MALVLILISFSYLWIKYLYRLQIKIMGFFFFLPCSHHIRILIFLESPCLMFVSVCVSLYLFVLLRIKPSIDWQDNGGEDPCDNGRKFNKNIEMNVHIGIDIVWHVDCGPMFCMYMRVYDCKLIQSWIYHFARI